MTTSTNNPPSAVPRLGPAWRGKGSGFQPPPAVPDAERRPPAGTSGTSTTNNNNGTRDRSNSNPFSALDDEEEGRFSHLRSTATSGGSSGTGATFTRSSSTGVVAAAVPSKPRSLADLAASVPRRGSASAAAVSSGGGENEKVLRYTREKLLSLRPRRGEGEGGELPEVLRHLEGSVVVSRVAQDPVCWDDFHPEEIWAAPPPARERRTTDRPLLKPLDRTSSGGRLRDVLDSGVDDSHPSTTSGSGSGTATRSRSNVGSSSTGRWQRGVALPPGNNEENRRSNSGGGRGESGFYPEADDPNDLWDDPGGGGTGAAPDFSQFGASLEEDIPPPKAKSGLGSGAFELSDMSRAAAAFEMELHGQENGRGNEENGEGVEGGEDSYSHRVDESRPLASSGTTIRSGSGDHVNVFEDFGDEEEEAAEEEQGTSAAESSKKGEDEEEVAIKSGNEMSASSRLMKMIGVGGSGDADGKGVATAVESKTEDPPATKVEAVQIASVPSNPWGAPVSIPSNPWGEPVVPDQSGGLVGLLSTQRAREAEIAAQRQREEEQRRRLLQEEEEKKRWAELQAKQQAEAQAQQQQQQQLRQQQQNQVELVLIERISNILENSWGRSDLVSILSTLHADDSRVIAILSNPDALRALINRHPQRIALVRDPAMGAEMAALIQTNQQWQIQQARLAQQQAQAQAREQQELQRRRALEAQQQRQRLEAIAREREAQERQMQLQQQQQQQQQHTHTVVADAPWFYADPQGNIQGPFGGDEMRQWLEAGYFKGNLPISQNNSGPFRPLSTYFPDPTTAFQPRVDESRAQAEARQKQAELAATAAELKRREEEAARAQAEAQQRELEVRARLKAEAESRMRAEEEAARIKAEEEAKHASEASNQNDQSVQLKMLLGLGGTSDAVASEPEPAPQPAAKKQSKSKTQQKQASVGQESPPAPVTEVAAAPAAPAWGGAVAVPTAGRKKTMSEIQQEEAKAAAKRAAEGGGGQRSGGGWANVAATGGSTAWGGAAAKTPAAGVIPPNTAVIAGVASVQKINTSRSAATVNNTQSQPPKSASNKDAVDNFGANGKMTPAFEKWCISQMQKINNSDDLTLVSFCMTLTDPIEIRQYLTAYLGSTPEVNNFATEFIKKKGGDNGRQEEWESAGGPKKGRKKKGGK
eukprot:CCRYP_012549-RC/>CCRYP_012549-RC protein AED:0.08 eAED:0.08 QI:405/1/1/1/0.5/0.28/7/635/1156